jgi:hypothetical protein
MAGRIPPALAFAAALDLPFQPARAAAEDSVWDLTRGFSHAARAGRQPDVAGQGAFAPISLLRQENVSERRAIVRVVR